MKKLFLFLALLTITSVLNAQVATQVIRGKVVDQVSQSPIPGVNVILISVDPVKGAVTDINGEFRIEPVAVGIHNLRVTFMGYEEKSISNLVVNSGKESVLHVDLTEKVIQGKEVTVVAEIEKEKPLNEMALVSARNFSVEETQKFAAAVNDPARMVTSFSGVVSADDGNNHISIRGNSPHALQWRMEGVEIPNPNHFSAPGTAGGGVSILSSQLLYNSDFLTGAFPSEYGNALSGVFDLRLRKGNNEKKEYTLQAGFLGIDLATEGPFKAGYKGSYLVNYRYSTLSAIGEMVELGAGKTDFQDLSFNIFLPAGKAGSFGIFGFGGLSSQKFNAEKDSSKWEDTSDRYTSKFSANTGAAGLTHTYIANNKTNIRTAAVYSIQDVSDETRYLLQDYKPELRFDGISSLHKVTFSTTVNHKFNSRHSIRSGVIFNHMIFSLDESELNFETDKFEKRIDADGTAQTLQAFTGWSFRITEKVTLNSGLHFNSFLLNETYSIEPRAGIRFATGEKSSIAAAYGLHSQVQPVGVYFAETSVNGITSRPNRNLDMSRSHHFVLSYDRMLTEYLHIKTEAYYQDLFDIPVSSDSSKTFSMVNQQWGYFTEPLVNKGTGRNYGLELTLEQFMHNQLYFLLSASVYNAEYKALDNKWRNTKYNGNYAVTFTSGKEWNTGSWFRNRIVGVNVKLIYTGGLRDTPVDLEKSRAEGSTFYFEDKAYTIQNPDYFRTDVKLSVKRNRPESTHSISLDIQNVTNRKNIYGKFYNPETDKVKTYYQAPLIPVLSYKVEF